MGNEFGKNASEALFDFEKIPAELKQHGLWGKNKFYDLWEQFPEGMDLGEPSHTFLKDKSISHKQMCEIEGNGEDAANFMALMMHFFFTEHPFSLPDLQRQAHVVDRKVTGRHDMHWVLHNHTPAYENKDIADRNRMNRFAVYKALLSVGLGRGQHEETPVVAAIDHVETHIHVEHHLRLYGMCMVPDPNSRNEDDFAIIIGTTIVPREIGPALKNFSRLLGCYRKIPFIEII